MKFLNFLVALCIIKISTIAFLFPYKVLAYDLLFQNYDRLHFKDLLQSYSEPVEINFKIIYNNSKTCVSHVKSLSTLTHLNI